MKPNCCHACLYKGRNEDETCNAIRRMRALMEGRCEFTRLGTGYFSRPDSMSFRGSECKFYQAHPDIPIHVLRMCYCYRGDLPSYENLKVSERRLQEYLEQPKTKMGG